MAKRLDLTGRRFGRLLVRREGRRYVRWNGSASIRWECLCDCGTETLVRTSSLISGATTSCGCYGREQSSKRRKKHGLSNTPTYNVWERMVRRCINPKDKDWCEYGGKGITVSERWREFVNFLADMGERPSPAYSIDRIDGSRGYEPGNCRWATAKEQSRNRCTNRYVTFQGKQMLLVEVAELLWISRHALRGRINAGWPEERWNELPLPRHLLAEHLYEYEPGRFYRAETLAALLGVSAATLRGRVRRGLPPSRWGEPVVLAA